MTGTSFLPVLSDPVADPAMVKRLIFLSGKHYYTLAKERENRGLNDVALVRLEVGILLYSCNFYVVTLQRWRLRPREQLLLQNYKA